MSRKIYALYKGDEFLCVGTSVECAEYLGVKPNTIHYYASNKHLKKIEKRENPKNYTIAIKLEDEEE